MTGAAFVLGMVWGAAVAGWLGFDAWRRERETVRMMQACMRATIRDCEKRLEGVK